ncbi:tetratricopeptide repeat protein 32 [Aplochiton taeniatus]
MADENSKLLEHANEKFNTRNLGEAEKLYTKFITSCLKTRRCESTDLATALNNRGQIKYLRVDFEEAIQDYTSAAEANGQFEVPFYNRGLILYRLGFFQDAERDFKQALKLNENFEDAKVSLQQTLLDQQNKSKRGY